MQFYQGHQTYYTYTATGTKLKVIDKMAPEGTFIPASGLNAMASNITFNATTTTDYDGSYIYQNDTLKMILLPEGYWQKGSYYYYLKDHLGNNRVTINSSGTEIEKSHYYPSGMRFFDASTGNSAALPYRYNGKELEAMNGLNQYDYGARRRGAGLPPFTTRDRFCEKFPWQSPYCHAANNPVNYIDVNGDSVSFKSAQIIDPNTVNQVKTDAQNFTGLTLNIDPNSGQMVYATTTDKKGRTIPLVAKDTNGKEIGSKTARKALVNAISNTMTVEVFATTRMNSQGGGLQINLNSNQINAFINGTSANLDSRTEGYGMTFFHELSHTDIGGKLSDASPITFSGGVTGIPFGASSSSVRNENAIRQELGPNFGQRTSYASSPTQSDGYNYIPMSNSSFRDLDRGIIPANSFIKY